MQASQNTRFLPSLLHPALLAFYYFVFVPVGWVRMQTSLTNLNAYVNSKRQHASPTQSAAPIQYNIKAMSH